jgi:hypothetical protein
MTRYTVVNFSNRHYADHRYLVSLGAYGWTRLLIWADSWDDAVDEAIDWCAKNAPGLLCDDAVNEEYKRAREEGLSEEDAQERATVDTICAGNYGNYIASWEINIHEDPSLADLRSIP